MKLKILTFTLLAFITMFLNANAQWTNNTSANSAICDTTGDQTSPKIASTSDGGCYIVWFDNRVANYPVFLQRLDAAGNKLYEKQGLLISNNPQNTFLQDYNIAVDASDNAVIVFTDRRNGAVLNPFAYLISPEGAFLWGPNGVSLTDSISLAQSIPVVTATSDGNYVFAWVYSSGPSRIAIQKLNSAGIPQWNSGVPIKLMGTGVAENFNFMRLINSDLGSVIMSWDSYTGNPATTNTIKIFIQKFSSTGIKLWTDPQDTVQNIGTVAGLSFMPYLVSDGQNGAVICWVEDRDVNGRQGAWAQRFNSSGVIQFPKNGSEGSTLSTNNHFLPSVTYLQSTGETAMFWTETNGGQTVVGGLYGQKFDATGASQWGSSGIEFKPLDNNQLSFISAYSKDSNIVVSYTEALFGGGGTVLKATRIGSSSAFHWPGNIVTASSVLSSKLRKQAILDKNSGQSVMTWSDNRGGAGGDIYAQNLKFNGEPGVCLLNLTIGIEGMWNGSAQVPDTLRVYLRNNTAPYAIADSAKVYLSTTGNATLYFPLAANGNYFIQLIHRNALETWSALDMNFTKGVATNYDFTTSLSQAYGNNQVLKGGRNCLFSGEINKDGSINLTDILIVYNNSTNFVTGYVSSDLDGNNVTNLFDLLIVANNAANFVIVKRPN